MTSRQNTDECALFRHGLALFNAGQWFEAHEAWEELWHPAIGTRREFYQGLIQCAVALEHVRRGNPRGAVTVFDSAKRRLAPLPAVYLGVDVRALLEGMQRLVDELRRMPKEAFEPRAGRGLKLPADLRDAPVICLQGGPFADGQSHRAAGAN